jgi:hypothetical protein
MTSAGTHLDHPTETSPELGAVGFLDTVIGAAEHWEEDGVHVIRGLEFDVIAGDPDFQAAVDQFVEKTQDLWSYLSGLEHLTDNENETFLLLAPRFLKIYKELERREAQRRQKLVSINLHRWRQRGEQHLRNWQPRSTPVSV